MVDSRSSWCFAFRAFSFARAALTSEISSFSRFWFWSKVSSEVPLEEEPGAGVKGVRGPCSEPVVSPFANLNPQLISVLLPISSVTCTPNFFCKEIPKVLKYRGQEKTIPQVMFLSHVCNAGDMTYRWPIG